VIVGADHWLEGVRRAASPNHDERPDRRDISLLVIHGISLPPGEFGGPWIDALFCNRLDTDAHPSFGDLLGVRVSSHAVIDRAGAVTQYVAFDRRAWHAGVSQWRGRISCNDFSIGIELEGTDRTPYTDAQYDALRIATMALLDRYPRLSLGTIVGHSEIAPTRKTDPGPVFDWSRLFSSLVSRSGG
jgi:AmpD protein